MTVSVRPTGRRLKAIRTMRCRKGDAVIARRRIEGMDVPLVPAGAGGTVQTTTMFDKPKRVFFAVSDGWGVKRFHVNVRRGDVEWCAEEDASVS